jgi:anti-sigma factor RsiW
MSEADAHETEEVLNDQLVAYLDGELDADATLRIERRLAEDEEFRRELQRLQQAWDMLDELPKSEVSETFTQTTVEIVALSAERELENQTVDAQRRTRWWWIAVSGASVVAAAASFWLLSLWFTRPNEQLVRDLPVIEDFDLYRVADSIEYVRLLEESGLFDEEVEDAL